MDSFAVARLCVGQRRFGNRHPIDRPCVHHRPRSAAPVEDIDTPALIVDLDAVRAQSSRRWRGLRATAGVGCGRTRRRTNARRSRCGRSRSARSASACRRSAEAEALVRGGVPRHPGQQRGRRRIEAAPPGRARARTRRSRLCFDDAEQVDAASRVAGGLRRRARRAGRDRGRDGALRRRGRARPPATSRAAIADAPGLRFRGPAGVSRPRPASADHRPSARRRSRARSKRCARRSRRSPPTASPCEIVTGAGTGTFRLEAASGVYNELQVGSYVFMDTDYAQDRRQGRRALHASSSTACSCSPR